MLPHETLMEAWKAIDAPEKWVRECRHDLRTGQRCAMGALDTVERAYKLKSFYCEGGAGMIACEVLAAAIPSTWDHPSSSPVRMVVNYNNTRKSWEEVRDWWTAAIELARREHNQPIVDDLVRIHVPVKDLETV